MFSKILIANRGEIACRVAATARRMGIKTVAVYSDADAHARHVADCDQAVRIGPAAARDSYLLGENIIAAALATGAQAIHPGYGFLSENAGFAAACAAAGLCFIGPPVAAIAAMGSKSAAKALMEQAGVPLVPGYHGEAQAPALLHAEADRIGYPVLLKASAGGGGKGMRIVEASADFIAALASCKREAASSFGDDKVLIERYLQRPRHIEIQVFADSHGECVFLFERDCSVQRRHQKVLEEAPAPGMSEPRRAAMGAAAVAAARAVGYVCAGTVEFIVEPGRDGQEGAFYFMEMNTRLQVEHPVTEMITGQDLVAWQLRVAAGEALPLHQSQLAIRGHAIEARIYAENPEKGFLPAVGSLLHLRTPAAVSFTTGIDDGGEPAAVRIDSGVRAGDVISPFYDPMIAKLIVWGPDRSVALARMADALAQYQVAGLATNIAFLQRLIAIAPFADAELDTGLIERHHAVLFVPPVPPAFAVLALACAAMLQAECGASLTSAFNAGTNPWAAMTGWRLFGSLRRHLLLNDGLNDYRLTVGYTDTGFILNLGEFTQTLQLLGEEGSAVAIKLGDDIVHGNVVRDGETLQVFHQGTHLGLTCADPLAHAGVAEAAAGRLTAPMPGKIVAVMVTEGEAVAAGTPLMIMEAMKMEHTIAAPRAGVVETVLYAVGDQVADGAPLLSFVAVEAPKPDTVT